MTLVFCTLLFASHIFVLIFFQGHKPTHVFKTRIVDADWLEDWESQSKKPDVFRIDYLKVLEFFKNFIAICYTNKIPI